MKYSEGFPSTCYGSPVRRIPIMCGPIYKGNPGVW